MTIRLVGVAFCLVPLVFAWGCADGEASVTSVENETHSNEEGVAVAGSESVTSEPSEVASEEAQPAEESPVIEEPQQGEPPPAEKRWPGQSVASKGNIAAELVGTWVLEISGFEDMLPPGFSDEEMAELSDGAEGVPDFEAMMSSMMGMFEKMKDTYVLNADGTFVKTTSMGFGGEGTGAVMEGVWSANGGWISFYIMRIVSDLPGQETRVIEFADATVMPPMAMKLGDDRAAFVDGSTIGAEMGGITVLYRKKSSED